MYNLSATNAPLDAVPDYVLGQPDLTSINCSYDGLSAKDMCNPTSIALDPAGHHLFVNDYGDQRVTAFNLSAANVPLDATADYVWGQPGFVTADTAGCAGGTPATDHNFCDPEGIAYDPTSGQLYVADTDNHRVLDFDLSGGLAGVTSAAHVLGQANFSDSLCNRGGAQADRATLCGPLSVSTDPGGRLFVADSTNARLLVYDATALANGANASAVLGTTDFVNPSDNWPANRWTLNPGIAQMAFDSASGRLFVPDSYDSRVVTFDLAHIITPSLAAGTTGSSYSASLSAAAVVGTPSFSLAAGTLPPGLVLGSGTVSGTPTTAGTYTFTVKLTDDLGSAGSLTSTRAYSLTVSTPTQSSSTPTPSPAAPSATPTASPAATSAPDVKLSLDNFTDYTSGSGQAESLKVGQAITFTSGGEEHTATVKEVGADYVILTLSSTPRDVRLAIGQTTQYDVSGDGKNDISVTLTGIIAGVAQLKFARIDAQAGETTTKKPAQPTSSAPARTSFAWLYWMLGIVALIILIVPVVARLRRPRSSNILGRS
jgi:hypothetical protein